MSIGFEPIGSAPIGADSIESGGGAGPVNYERTLSENLTITDSLNVGEISNRILNDNPEPADLLQQETIIYRALQSALDTSDLNVQYLINGKNLKDNPDTTDIQWQALNLSRGLVDSVDTTSTVSIEIEINSYTVYNRTLTDNPDPTDSIVVGEITNRTLTDNPDPADSVSIETVVGSYTVVERTLSDNPSVYDNQWQALEFNRGLDDNPDLADSVTQELIGGPQIYDRTLNESLTIYEYISLVLPGVTEITLSESFGQEDGGVFPSVNYNFDIENNPTAADSVIITHDVYFQGETRILSDNVETIGDGDPADPIEVLTEYNISGEQSITALDGTEEETNFIYERTLTGNPSVNDSMAAGTSGLVVERTVSDSTDPTDGESEQAIIYNFIGTQSLDISETLIQELQLDGGAGRTLNDDLTPDDSDSEYHIFEYRVIDQAVDAFDAVSIEITDLSLSEIVRTLSDSIATITDGEVESYTNVNAFGTNSADVIDLAGVCKLRNRRLIESIDANDLINLFVTGGIVLNRILESGIDLADSVSISELTNRTLSSNPDIVDALTQEIESASIRVLRENISTITDTISAQAEYKLTRILSDSLSVTDEKAAEIIAEILETILFAVESKDIEIGVTRISKTETVREPSIETGVR